MGRGRRSFWTHPDPGGRMTMRGSKLARAGAAAALLALALPAAASADTFDRAGSTGLLQSVAINSIWVIVAGCLVMFMQAGFAFLEIVFSGFLYPVASGWVFGGGWLQANVGMQDFAGSTAVHLIGATGALAALLFLGPRRGKYGTDGKPRAIPGHNMPLFGLGIFILW